MPIKFKRRSKKRSGIASWDEYFTPKEFVLATMNIYIEQHSKKYNLTTWNAYMKLTEQKAFKSLMRKWFDNEVKLKRFLKSKEKIRAFYKNNIKRGNAKVKKIATTNPKYFTRRKKRK